VSDDNVAVVRRFWSSPLDALPHVIDADIDYRAIEGAPDDVGVMHGRDEMVRCALPCSTRSATGGLSAGAST